MKFALLSVVELEGTPFVSMLIYQYFTIGDRQIAREVGVITKPFESEAELILDLLEYEIDTVETDSRTLYSILVKRPFVPVTFKLDIEGTQEAVERYADSLKELYGIENIKTSDYKPSKWRTWCIEKLEKVIQKLKNKGDKQK